MRNVLLIALIAPLAACSGGGLGSVGDRSATGVAFDADAALQGSNAVEITTDASGALADDAPPEGPGRFLGFSVASLGDASIPGFWVETPLVDVEGPGRIVAENGTSVTVDLRPSGGTVGSGSRMSLETYRILGIPLTALPTVTVISDA
ncbi:MAG: hypothetical protein RIB61_11420 [Roseicyclus sp.]